MNVAFFTPPAARRIGGLDAAIDGLREALEQQDVRVYSDLSSAQVGHFHGLWECPFVRAARQCRSRGIPYVVSPHGMLEPWAWRHKWWKKAPYFHLIEKRFLNDAACVLATSDDEARRLTRRLPRQHVVTLPLGLTGQAKPDDEAARRLLGWMPEERVLLYLSRLHLKKGLDLLLRALSTMTVPSNVRLVIVGDGPTDYVNAVQRFSRAQASHLPNLEWKGAVWGDARWPYFQGADLFCLPTHSENFGLAVLEACQVGTPVLTTTGTPWAEHLRDGRGFICEPTIESIRATLTSALAQPRPDSTARAELSGWAWQNFSWDRLAGRYADLYQSLLVR